MAQDVTAAAPSAVTITIPAGRALSEPLVVKGKIRGLIMPDDWDSADLTFLGGQNRDHLRDVYDWAAERALIAAVAKPGRAVCMDALGNWSFINVIVLRSGTSAAPVPQSAQRDFTLILSG